MNKNISQLAGERTQTVKDIKLKRGMRVTVYGEPGEKTHPEGTAELLSDDKVTHGNQWYHTDGIRRLHMWFVKFDNGDKCDRWVCPQDIMA